MSCPHEIIMLLQDEGGAEIGMVCTYCAETWTLGEIKEILRRNGNRRIPAVEAIKAIAERERSRLAPKETKDGEER